MNRAMNPTASLTAKEAQRHIAEAVERCIVHWPTVQIDEIDEVITWSARVECVDTGALGWACFDEHYGEVDIAWR